MLRPPPPPPRAEEEAPVFSPLLLPPHRSARAERPEAGGRSGEEAPGSPRRGRLGPPPAPLRSALLLAAGQPQRLRITAPQSAGAASQSARGRGAAPRRQPPGLQRGARRGGKRPGGGWGTGTGGPPRARSARCGEGRLWETSCALLLPDAPFLSVTFVSPRSVRACGVQDPRASPVAL